MHLVKKEINQHLTHDRIVSSFAIMSDYEFETKIYDGISKAILSKRESKESENTNKNTSQSQSQIKTKRNRVTDYESGLDYDPIADIYYVPKNMIKDDGTVKSPLPFELINAQTATAYLYIGFADVGNQYISSQY